MAYHIFLRPAAARDLESLEPSTKRRVEKTLDGLGENPRPSGTKKLVGFGNEWRLRVGSYRVLYLIDDHEKILTVARVAHRREAYR